MSHSKRALTALIVVVFGVASVVWAAPIPYGNISGDSVVYQQLSEDSSTDPGIALYGAPTVSGDGLFFNPAFAATASGGATNQTFGSLTATIVATNGTAIELLQFQEQGDFSLMGAGTSATTAEVSATFLISIIEVDGVAVTPVNVIEQMAFTAGAAPSDGQFNIADEPGGTQPWAGLVQIDLNQVLFDAGVAGQATKVAIELDNRLAVASEATTYSHIAKKTLGGFSVTAVTNIPEPATMSLLALGGLAMLKRRK